MVISGAFFSVLKLLTKKIKSLRAKIFVRKKRLISELHDVLIY